MTTAPSFGRRHAGPARPARSPPTEAAASPGVSADDPRLDALRAEMLARRRGGRDAGGFGGWMAERQLGRWTAWFATFALMALGAVCAMAHAPPVVSMGCEAAALAGGWWLRRQRRERLALIRDWAPDPFEAPPAWDQNPSSRA